MSTTRFTGVWGRSVRGLAYASGWCVSAAIIVAAAAAGMAAESQQLVVHEWGTFTALQDDQGRALGGINIDDEQLPSFVHNLGNYVPGRSYSLESPGLMKGAPARHPLVRMRLETPVIYFYPAAGEKLPLTLDLKVKFRGGWLTQFYPEASVDAPGLRNGDFRFGELNNKTLGALTWSNLRVGTKDPSLNTESPVWTAPREVDAVQVTSEGGESEKYLFYRGVGNFEAPMSISTQASENSLMLRPRFGDVLHGDQSLKLGPLWLVHVRADGSCAYRTLDNIKATANSQVAGVAKLGFEPKDYSATNLHRLCASMDDALEHEGLYPAEATALLETWRRAYFKSAGLRVFFMVPQAWTDYYLPMQISKPADIKRVMVARIELVSPEQHALLDTLRTMKVSDAAWLQQVQESPNAKRFLEGRSDFGDLGVKIPDDYQTYLDLGRFRNALVIAEEQHHPNGSLTQFIETYGLEPYRWEEKK